MPTLEERISALIEQGVTPEDITRIARKRATQATKEYFLAALIDPQQSPEAYCFQFSVENWQCIRDFMSMATTEQHHPQRIFQDLRNDATEAIANEDALGLILTLLLGAKAIQS